MEVGGKGHYRYGLHKKTLTTNARVARAFYVHAIVSEQVLWLLPRPFLHHITHCCSKQDILHRVINQFGRFVADLH